MNYLEACKTLGVESDAALSEAKAAYRRLAQQHHPDKGGDADAFKNIALAYKTFKKQAPFIRHIKRKQPPPTENKTNKEKAAAQKAYFREEAQAAWRTTAADKGKHQREYLHENRRLFLILGVFFAFFYLLWRAGESVVLPYACLTLDVAAQVVGMTTIFLRCTENNWSLPIYLSLVAVVFLWTISDWRLRRFVLQVSNIFQRARD